VAKEKADNKQASEKLLEKQNPGSETPLDPLIQV
jgi:hypothetical protein